MIIMCQIVKKKLTRSITKWEQVRHDGGLRVQVGIKIGNSIVSVDESKVFIEKVEFDKEFVRVVNKEVLEMIIDMINEEFKGKIHSIAIEVFFEEIKVENYKALDEVEKAESFRNVEITFDELEHGKAVRRVKVKNWVFFKAKIFFENQDQDWQ